jgi:sugar-specific transcriptional regulator TrmB
MEIPLILKNFGLNEKEIAVYLALVELGPSPVRVIAQKSKINRGTSYDILKALQSQGLVSFFDTKSRQHFVAEPPEKLVSAVEEKQESLAQLKKQIQKDLPELKSIFEKNGGRPMVKMYEGLRGVKTILEDVLSSVSASKEKVYYVYSSSTVRKNVYEAMPKFTDERIAKKIRVKTIALGSGGKVFGLDERKWMALPEEGLKPVYEMIYAGKVAHISLDNSANPVGVVIEDREIFETQKMIFEFNWGKL